MQVSGPALRSLANFYMSSSNFAVHFRRQLITHYGKIRFSSHEVLRTSKFLSGYRSRWALKFVVALAYLDKCVLSYRVYRWRWYVKKGVFLKHLNLNSELEFLSIFPVGLMSWQNFWGVGWRKLLRSSFVANGDENLGVWCITVPSSLHPRALLLESMCISNTFCLCKAKVKQL